jgi:alkanesulfonate monooxygenase SsuD/methylene tetrahydromethanopterin reductase-like flavin-dependent oxidoreductase (luciferase family)
MATFGLIIPQRSALFGAGNLVDLLRMAVTAEESGFFDTVWVGDSLTSKARADSLSCIGALAGMTERIRLGVGCMASFALRDPALFAYQWASLDQVSNGRVLLAVCNGLQKHDGASEREGRHFGGVTDAQRPARLEENLELCRKLWTGQPVTFHGRYVSYDDIEIGPVPLQEPLPVWLSGNPPMGSMGRRVLGRAASLTDGYLTSQAAKGYLADARAGLADQLNAVGKSIDNFPLGLYHNINVGPNAEICLDEAHRFYDNYYGPGFFDRSGAAAFTAYGSPEQCIEHLQELIGEGATHIGLRLATWSQRRQLETVIEQVMPVVFGG